jgi:hypothetical protein
MEVRDWLRDAIDNDEQEHCSPDAEGPSAISCLVKALDLQPLQVKAASDSALGIGMLYVEWQSVYMLYVEWQLVYMLYVE